MNNPLISIIIPAFNVENFIFHCINSIISQSYKHFEILIINDGSTDSTMNLCQKLVEKDNRIRLINILNQGVSNARNIGIDLSGGEYIMFVDADDWLAQNTLEKCVNHQLKFQSDIVFFSFIRVSGSTFINDTYLKRNYGVFNREDLFKRRVVGYSDGQISEPTKTDAYNTPWAKLYKRIVIGDIRYIERAKVGMEDVLFNIEVINASTTFSYLDEYLYYYRLDNPNSLTKTDTNSLYHKFEKLFNHIESGIFFNESYQSNLNNRVACSIINICLSLTHNNNRMGLLNEWMYLNTILHSKRYINAYKRFSIKGMSFHWSFFFFLAKYKLTTGLLLLSYIIRLIK